VREALFIKKNKDRWLRIQHMPSDDPDEMASDFVQLVDDLAYAKTFYPTGKVTSYINAQASNIYLDIYQNRKEESNKLVNFWKYDLPLTIRKHYKVIIFQMLGAGGDGYIEDTKERIRSGNPFGIFEGGSSVAVWLGIMVNNILVALRDFASGIAFGLPALYNMGKFGVMSAHISFEFFALKNDLSKIAQKPCQIFLATYFCLNYSKLQTILNF